MPQFSRDAFHPDAKVSKYNCGFCGKLFYTKKAGSEYCSDKWRFRAKCTTFSALM